MSHIIIEESGLIISMNIEPEGRVRGEVFEKGNRFAAIDFTVNDRMTEESEGRSISVGLPGVKVTGGNSVAAMFFKLEKARHMAETMHDMIQNFRDSSDFFLMSVNQAVTQKDVDSVILMLAATPLTIDAEVVKKALVRVMDSGLLGDLATAKGLESASDNVFHAIHNALTCIAGDRKLSPMEEETDEDPNAVVSNYLCGLKAA